MRHLLIIGIIACFSSNMSAQDGWALCDSSPVHDCFKIIGMLENPFDEIKEIVTLKVEENWSNEKRFKASVKLNNPLGLVFPGDVNDFKPSKDLSFKSVNLKLGNSSQGVSLKGVKIVGVEARGSGTLVHLKYKTVR